LAKLTMLECTNTRWNLCTFIYKTMQNRGCKQHHTCVSRNCFDSDC